MAYITIITEGGLLPADILDAIIEASEITGQRPEDFGLERGRSLNDRIAAAWQAARGHWMLFKTYVDELQASDAATTLTRQRWMLPLLDLLGYQLSYSHAAATVAGRSYAISHRAGAHEDAPPVHIEGIGRSLDARPPSGRPRLSPHALLQEYLNGTEQLWGIVTNGERLRLLRDSSRFTRPAYVEFDLRTMFEGEHYSEFALLYRLLHRSRLPHSSADAANSLLESYHQRAIESGGRVRERLRDGVELALKTLGAGLLEHPANTELCTKLRSGKLSALAYYRQLLKLVYRLLFLMVAEERGLIAAGTRRLVTTEDDPFEVSSGQSFDAVLSRLIMSPTVSERLNIYYQHYSLARLRRMAEQPAAGRGPYDDLWMGLQTTFRLLEGSDEQSPRSLGLSALDGDLFGLDAIKDLEGQRMRNQQLLCAIRALSLYCEKESKSLRRVNYGALDVEELGSVYESLLDYRPVVEHRQAQVGSQHRAGELEDHASIPLTFDLVAGTERKTTGSYYTRPELVQELIKTALVPVLDAKLKGMSSPAMAEQALLSMRVVDPACGSGHFLLAAARRLGRELARIRSGEEQPTPTEFRRAVRDVIQHCIYGVDLNPLAVDLCKLALWIEGHNAGMPLSFLDHHIKQGNSLIGARADLLAAGIPDEAYKPVTGDDKKTANDARKRNKDQRGAYKEGYAQDDMFAFDTQSSNATLALALRRLDDMASSSVAEVRAKARRYQELRQQAEADRLRYNLWTAAFFQPLTPENAAYIISTADLQSIDIGHIKAIQSESLADQLSFFHWELEFPQVFTSELSPQDPRQYVAGALTAQAWDGAEGKAGSFDVVLGNPPWERIKLQEQEHWVDVAEVRDAPNKAARERVIQLWRTGTASQRTRVAQFDSARYRAEAESRFVRASGRFPLSAVGDVNTYALFAEQARRLIDDHGRAGIIVPTGIATDDTTKLFFADLNLNKQLVSLYDFENREAIFPGVHRSYKFSLLTMGQTKQASRFTFFATNISHLQDEQRSFTLSAEDIALINPNTRTAPIFRTRADAELTKQIYRRVPVLLNQQSKTNPWGLRFMAMFHMANDSGLFHTQPGAGLLPLYEAKLLHQFTHRWATYDRSQSTVPKSGNAESGSRDMTLEELTDPNVVTIPRYWLSYQEINSRLNEIGWQYNWLLGWRDITNATNERSFISSFLPLSAVGDTFLLIFPETKTISMVCLMGCLNSLVFDFVARQKIAGIHAKYFTVKQLPVLPPSAFSQADIAWIVPRVLELVYTAWDMQPFAQDIWNEANAEIRSAIMERNAACNASANPALFRPRDGFALAPFCWDEQRRAIIRAQLDARIARLYGLSRDELRYMLDPQELYGHDFPGESFRVLKEKEIRQYGEYRTRRLVLEAWDHGA